MKQYGWGILGPGAIATRFVNDLRHCPQARLAAVASRDADKAAHFAARHGFAGSHGSYEALLADPAVDVVYIAVPHPMHHRLAMAAMEAGKAVLCEKPVALNATQAREMVACAARNKVFFMEAMWTRFFPVNQRVQQLVAARALGDVTLMEIDFGFGQWQRGKVDNPNARLFSPALAGGSLLDVGVYCVSYATWLKGALPVEIKALDSKVETGVDGMTAALFRYADGAMAVLRSSIVQQTEQRAVIHCEHGTMEVPDFWHPSQAVVRHHDNQWPDERVEIPYDRDGATGFQYEAQTVMDCLDKGLLENPDMTWAQSVEIMTLLDMIREQTGLDV